MTQTVAEMINEVANSGATVGDFALGVNARFAVCTSAISPASRVRELRRKAAAKLGWSVAEVTRFTTELPARIADGKRPNFAHVAKMAETNKAKAAKAHAANRVAMAQAASGSCQTRVDEAQANLQAASAAAAEAQGKNDRAAAAQVAASAKEALANAKALQAANSGILAAA